MARNANSSRFGKWLDLRFSQVAERRSCCVFGLLYGWRVFLFISCIPSKLLKRRSGFGDERMSDHQLSTGSDPSLLHPQDQLQVAGSMGSFCFMQFFWGSKDNKRVSFGFWRLPEFWVSGYPQSLFEVMFIKARSCNICVTFATFEVAKVKVNEASTSSSSCSRPETLKILDPKTESVTFNDSGSGNDVETCKVYVSGCQLKVRGTNLPIFLEM